jgi:hypothetical protein
MLTLDQWRVLALVTIAVVLILILLFGVDVTE